MTVVPPARCLAWVLLLGVACPRGANAQPLTTTLPPITVTAQKEPDDPQKLPLSLSTVSGETLLRAAFGSVGEAGRLAPNTFFNEFTARKLSNARFRGVGSSPSNPGITSYVDGVPQLNANSSSIELVDVDQIEFVRGPQSALFGRNALGGIINITSARPSLTRWAGSLAGPYGSYNGGDLRGTVSGPIVRDKVAIGIGVGYGGRDGFTTNSTTGNGLDTRSAFFGKGQILFKPSPGWEGRAIVSVERARDGDYGLNDVGALRSRPFESARSFEGHTNRDILAPTIQLAYSGPRFEMSSTTGFLKWSTDDLTDLDYSALPLVTRDNAESDFQFTQEVRVSSAKAAPIRLSDGVALKWQAGVALFTQNYTQEAQNTYAPFVLSPFLGVEVSDHSPQAALDDTGVGIYGQGTFTFAKRLDVVVGVRADREHRQADLNTFFVPAIAPGSALTAEADFSDVSPQFAASYRVARGASVYGTVSRGFKAGGFNPASPVESQTYGQEHSWNYEAGVKALALGDRFSAALATFYIDWTDLQVNVPNPFVPTQFFIANAAGATSKGVELELHARPDRGLDVFGAAGFTNARFSVGSRSSGVDVGGRKLANMPSYTAEFGVQYTRPLRGELAVIARAEAVCYGDLQYDDPNAMGQEAYTLTNLRAGLQRQRVFAELWVRNAFDTRYIPVAFPAPGLAASGFLGENGAPRTFGVRAGVSF